MRAPLSWIREFTPIDAPVVEIADALNQLGLEVEEIDAPGAGIDGVVVARILDVLPHPAADKIRLADVDFGDGQLRVVCGAPNIYPGMIAPFAKVGARLPGGLEITKREIRGVASEGMLCSSRELGLGDDHSGILELPGDPALGTDVREVLGLDDVVFHLAITPNRPDAMGIVGVARELAAHFGTPLDVPILPSAPTVETIGDVTAVVEAPGRCPRLVVRCAKVRLGASPEWMQRRLRLAGMRPISNVVDVTNYVMLERCRPLHAFDLARLAGRGIVVRLARDGEHMTTLDGVERVLTAEDLLICDAQRRPQAIAGIMGGANSEVDSTTTEIAIESAYFEPAGIAKSSKRLGLRSEASARFERGIDPNGTATGADYAIRLLQEVAAAEAMDGAIDRYPEPVERVHITVRTDRVNAVLGTDLAADQVRALVKPLGIECDGDAATFVAIAPTFRPDLAREVDIVEEVGRRFGLDNIARTVAQPPAGSVGRLTRPQQERRVIADVLVGAGCLEAYTLPLVAPSDLARAGIAATTLVEVANPLRAEESVLRPSLRPGLLEAAAYNAGHANTDLALFELGTVFLPPRDGDLLPDEREHVGALLAGTRRLAPRAADQPVGAADAVDLVDALRDALGLADLVLVSARIPGLHPSRGARVLVDGNDAGVVGDVAASVLAAWGLPGPAAVLELDVGVLLAGMRGDGIYRVVSPFPPANIDLAFVVADSVPSAAVLATLREAGGDLLEEARLFDVFRSDEFGAGRSSLAYALRFRAPDRTLTDDEVAKLRARCIDAVVTAHAAELRG